MAGNDDDESASRTKLSWTQFSLGALFGMMTSFAVLCAYLGPDRLKSQIAVGLPIFIVTWVLVVSALKRFFGKRYQSVKT
jgi:hypothetical protein